MNIVTLLFLLIFCTALLNLCAITKFSFFLIFFLVDVGKNVLERDITLGQLYGINSIMILQQTINRVVEVVIYMLNGPGLTAKKSHILRLGYNGRFAINIVDDLVVVHHQATKTSHLFDIMLPGEQDTVTGIIIQTPVTPGKPIKPFVLKLPSLAYDHTNIMECELYSPNWVLFQPDIVIDAKLGCLWNVELKLEPISCFIGDNYVKKVDFLLRRTRAKNILLTVIHELLSKQYSGTKLPIIEQIFDKINTTYKNELDNDLLRHMALPSSSKSTDLGRDSQSARVLIDQNDMFSCVFSSLNDCTHFGRVLMLYIHSLVKHKITLQHELSKMIMTDLIKKKKINALHQLLCLSAINESKPLACFLLSMSKIDDRVFQVAMDMLARIDAHEIILEVLLEQGFVVEALKISKQSPNADFIPARKYLESAIKTNDALVFQSVYAFFQQRNIKLRGTVEFLKRK